VLIVPRVLKSQKTDKFANFRADSCIVLPLDAGILLRNPQVRPLNLACHLRRKIKAMKVMSDKEHKDQGPQDPKGPSRIPLPSSKRGFSGFVSETLAEMKRVHWPTKPETTRLTGVVVTVCVGSVLLLYGLSVAFEVLLSLLTKKGPN